MTHFLEERQEGKFWVPKPHASKEKLSCVLWEVVEGMGLANPKEEETWDAGEIRESLQMSKTVQVEEQAD